ncbi:MAG TPA: DUF4113 domain-containing protein, partial [Pseudobdellovibrionaceae bacterium]|nr:DUF4113 domain-containing protein [Pseudobdellovibrionaceae bacterium]
ILTQTGIPVSIGLGPTKVLAKAANRVSKKNKVQSQGFFSLLDLKTQEVVLKNFDVKDIWGIGHASAKKLYDLKIRSASQLRDANEYLIQKQLTVVGRRILQELRGESCIQLEQIVKEKKSICSSRSFGRPVYELSALKESVANHVHTAAEKMRKDFSRARSIQVFIQTNPFKNSPQYYNSATIELLSGTASTPKMIKQAFCGLESIYKKGYEYKKCGVILNDLFSQEYAQLDFFSSYDTPTDEKLMMTMDTINRQEGRGTLKPAACGVDPFWKMLSEMKSRAYTTRWSELLEVG